MNSYTVIITPAAEADVVESFAYIQERSPLNAERWLRQLYKAIHDLEGFAGHGRAREADFLDADLRQKIFKSHRIVYTVDKAAKIVTVHYVRHASRRAVGDIPDDE